MGTKINPRSGESLLFYILLFLIRFINASFIDVMKLITQFE